MKRKVVTISTTTCGPCIMLRGIMDNRHPNGLPDYENIRINMYKKNEDGSFLGLSPEGDDALTYMSKKAIYSVPCTVFFQDGGVVNSIQGVAAAPEITEFLNQEVEVATTEGEQLNLEL